MNNPTDQTVNIYNEQVANNQLSNQLPNLVGSTSGNVYPSWDNHQGQPFNIQQQLFNSQGQPVCLQQPLFTYLPIPTAALTPFLSQAAILQNYHQLLAQTSLHNNSTFIQQQEQFGQNQQTPIKRSFNHQNNYWNDQQYHKQEYNRNNGSDLRTKLIRKRICSATPGNNHVDFEHDESTTFEKKKKIETWSTPALQAKPLTLAPLKTLTATNSESNQWVIVVETDIILENYTFLDDLVTADPDCHLGIPHHVMSELRMHVSMSSDVRPRRILRFLTQQIENGMAILGEQEEGYNSSHNTILTLVKLATRNYVAILITNNKETLTFKLNRKGMHLFTMRNVKDILENKFPKPRASSPTMAIKIAVPNNLNNEKETRDPENNITRELFNHYNQSNSNNDKPDTPPPPATTNEIIVHNEASNVVAPLISPTQTTKAVPCNINTVDVEEVSEGARDELCRRGSATFIAPTDPNRANFHHRSKINNPVSDSNAAPNYTPTKLEFATPSKVNKWNRTGNKNMHDTMDTSSTSSTSNISLDSTSIKKKILTTSTSKRQIDNVKEITPPIIGSKSPNGEQNLEKTAKKNLAMGENSASTSGVINSKSFNSHKVIIPKKQDVKKVSRRRRLVMYEVVGQSMEEVLRLRSEEWVLRFVQIMEEVLRVKLQEKMPYEQKEPAPRNLKEAARSIVLKSELTLKYPFDVIEAGNHLERCLSETSDQNGKIINIEPSDYMEMYSYGVFLVETLLDTCTDCKECTTKKNEKRGSFSGEKCSCYELGTASERLKKLLFDINNANVETFADQEVDHPPDFLMDSSVDDSTDNDFNMNPKKQSSKEVDKTNTNEINNAENAKRFLIKRKHFDSVLKVTPNLKKTNGTLNGPQSTKKTNGSLNGPQSKKKTNRSLNGPQSTKKTKGSLNGPQSTKKVYKAIKEGDVKVLPPDVTNITTGTSSDSAFVSSLRLVKEDLNDADKLKACKITVLCSNTQVAPDEPKDPSRSSPEKFLDLKCHFGKEDNLLEELPQKVSCTFKKNEDMEKNLKGKCRRLGLNLTKLFIKVTSMCETLMHENNEELYCKLSSAIKHLETVQKALKRSENSEDNLNDDRCSLQYRRFIAKCQRTTKTVLKGVREIFNKIDEKGVMMQSPR